MIIDEETFEEQAQIRTSRLKIFFIPVLLMRVLSGIIFSTIVVTVVTVDRSSVETTPCELSGAEHVAIKIDIKIIK